MNNKFRTAASVLPILPLLLIGGCGVQPVHPNQISAFDGASYDTLTLAHGALASLRPQIAAHYPKYTGLFNQAVAAYSAALTGYSVFRTDPVNQAGVAVEVTNLTLAIVSLESAFQMDMQLAPASIGKARRKAEHIRRSASNAGVSVSDILTELEIAAAVARAVPAAAPYAGLAEIVITSTTAALNAEQASSGQSIDLSLIQAIQFIQ